MEICYKDSKKFTNGLFSDSEILRILSTVTRYCNEFKNKLNKNAEKALRNGTLYEFCKDHIEKSLNKVFYPTPRTTAPDGLTSILLEKVYHHDPIERDRVVETYAHQKQAEMYIGALLELYIQKKGHELGWCFTGTIIKDVDFVRRVDDSWHTYQIKNSDNTENNAAAQVRNNTKIFKWVRRNSKKINTYYWNVFPDDELRAKVSEADFRKFIDSYYDNIRPAN